MRTKQNFGWTTYSSTEREADRFLTCTARATDSPVYPGNRHTLHRQPPEPRTFPLPSSNYSAIPPHRSDTERWSPSCTSLPLPSSCRAFRTSWWFRCSLGLWCSRSRRRSSDRKCLPQPVMQRRFRRDMRASADSLDPLSCCTPHPAQPSSYRFEIQRHRRKLRPVHRSESPL